MASGKGNARVVLTTTAAGRNPSPFSKPFPSSSTACTSTGTSTSCSRVPFLLGFTQVVEGSSLNVALSSFQTHHRLSLSGQLPDPQTRSAAAHARLSPLSTALLQIRSLSPLSTALPKNTGGHGGYKENFPGLQPTRHPATTFRINTAHASRFTIAGTISPPNRIGNKDGGKS